jgi:hypothetical protein
MHASSDRMRRLAGRILTVARTSEQVGAVGFAVCETLRQSLSPLAGVAGFRSLLSRALGLAAGEIDWLKAVTIKPDGSLAGLEVVAGLPAIEVDRGETILIAHLLSLLITFIGESLTLRLLQDAWPEISRDDMTSGPETTK